MQKFGLHESHFKFFMIVKDKNRTSCRVLKIDNLEPIYTSEDSSIFLEIESCGLLNRIQEGNKSTREREFETSNIGKQRKNKAH